MALSANIIARVKRPNFIIANTVPLTSTQSNPPIELKSNLPGVGQNYVRNLLDVVEDHPADGFTLIYNAEIKKYQVRSVEVGSAQIDGGTF